MQQVPVPTSTAPSFGQLVLGSMLGYLGCILVPIVLGICIFVVLMIMGVSAASFIPRNLPTP